jgi:hypothetical protein
MNLKSISFVDNVLIITPDGGDPLVRPIDWTDGMAIADAEALVKTEIDAVLGEDGSAYVHIEEENGQRKATIMTLAAGKPAPHGAWWV